MTRRPRAQASGRCCTPSRLAAHRRWFGWGHSEDRSEGRRRAAPVRGGPSILAVVLAVGLPVELASGGCRSGEPAGADAEAEAAAKSTQAPPATREADARELVRADGTLFAETELMGTRASVNVWLRPEDDAAAAQLAIRDAIYEMARIESIASEWQADSDLSRLNRLAGSSVEVAPELIEILERARAVSADSDGRFDVSFYAVGELWRFEPGARPPPTEAIAARLPKVDWRKIEFDPTAGTARLAEPGMKVGLGAIAKGYAVDRASALVAERGFVHHIVEAGGDTRVRGRKGTSEWRVGVQDPTQASGRIGYLLARDEAVVTSGNYARYFEWEGVHYSHILDPSSGWPIPVDRSPKSVTLLAPDATAADAYCTAVSVMEPAEGMAFVEARPTLEAVILTADGRTLISSGLRARFIDERE